MVNRPVEELSNGLKSIKISFAVLDKIASEFRYVRELIYHSTSITIPNTTWLGVVSINQNTSILYPSSHDGNTTFGFALVCPTGYCKPGITEVNMTEQDSLCQHHRTGVLCGGCEDGYSLVLGPNECQICNSNL